ncbi:MAG: LysM peptidoglycan-binding domain-containing protein [Bradyrhizobium sp.]|nr:MAG: LysM peptidoglycan-binding domain-containing protein [Bradyrhizobium sp.]
MREFAAFDLRRGVVRIALTGLVGAWLAGCSTDSDRFSQSYAPASSPFTNPFASNAPDAAPTSSVASAPLAPPDAVATADVPPATYQPAQPIVPHVASAQPVGGSAAGWSIVGGSPIVVAQGDSADTLSQRYGVPSAALLKTNGLSNASQIHGGMHIIVPVYSADNSPVGGKSKSVASSDDAAPVKHAKAKEARDDDAADAKRAKAKLAKEDKDDDAAPKKQAKATDKSSDKSNDKTADKSADKPAAKSTEKSADKSADKSAKTLPAKTLVADAKDSDAGTTTAKKSAPDTMPTSAVRPGDAAAPLTGAQADAAGVAPEFRWPARGRIIEGFKAGGNDGINIAVPEGTSVRAAESGVVAYAGDELKGYGNLVLIRHPNGFVSAYANNGELDVKRGDTVKRGQIIAKSGQTGNVNSPQLHFELRKGSTPVDPTSYLAGL